MATTEGLRHQGSGGRPAHVTGSGSGRPIARRRLGQFHGTGCALVVGLVLCGAGLVTVAGAAIITEFPLPTANSGPVAITAGSDGALWFTELFGHKIGRITTAGAITEFALPAGGNLSDITMGPDGALWFTDGTIGRITTGGVITKFAGAAGYGITAGPDGALWFTEFSGNKIGRITTGGTVTEFPIPTFPLGSHSPVAIAAGPDGALWFTEYQANRIGRITTGGTVTEFATPRDVNSFSFPLGITAGPDGALWFGEEVGSAIGRISTEGGVAEFLLPAGTQPLAITAGPDGALWFTEAAGNRIGRMSTLGVITNEFTLPTPNSIPQGITTGPDGALWFTERGANKIGRITTSSVTLAVSILGSGTGIVTSIPPGITCSTGNVGTCTTIFSPGSSVTLGANAAPGASFGGWGGDCAGFGTSLPCTLSLTAPKSVTATFNPPFPTDAATAFVTRLYEQVLSREPDPAGLQAFVAQIQQFGSVVPTVLAFFHSQEFLGRNTTNEQFLTICYRTFLDREPDPVGFDAFFVDLQSGLRTRDNLLDIFLDSQEFAALASFLPPQDPVTAFVINLYVRILGRGPDQAGLQGFVAQLQQTRTVLPTVLNFLHSPEFLARNTNNTEYVTVLYRVFLDRVPDASGLAGWVALLTQGTATRDQLASQFAASPEFQAIQHQLFP